LNGSITRAAGTGPVIVLNDTKCGLNGTIRL
jgi:hypothetical protein